jgi:eukaryotic-like serine/threonine-protein kinase
MGTRKKSCPQCGTDYGPEQKFCPADGATLLAHPSEDPLLGQVIADRYHITGLIGEGGMGCVYSAEHVRMGRKCALKVMSPALATTADAITRFNREAANAARINHPNVAAIYDFGETPDGLLYIAMEFVDGETLRALIERIGPLPTERAAQITKGAAEALYAAHHLGIVHRDLKPDNIMLARQLDGSDWVKVVDFGIAKSVAAVGRGSGGQTVTTAGVSLGTPEYMSPEQLAGEKLDHRTDIYSLGLVLFNMLTGRLPYPKLTSKETLVRRLTSPPATLADVRPDIKWPPQVQAVMSRALDPEPDRR